MQSTQTSRSRILNLDFFPERGASRSPIRNLCFCISWGAGRREQWAAKQPHSGDTSTPWIQIPALLEAVWSAGLKLVPQHPTASAAHCCEPHPIPLTGWESTAGLRAWRIKIGTKASNTQILVLNTYKVVSSFLWGKELLGEGFLCLSHILSYKTLHIFMEIYFSTLSPSRHCLRGKNPHK